MYVFNDEGDSPSESGKRRRGPLGSGSRRRPTPRRASTPARTSTPRSCTRSAPRRCSGSRVRSRRRRQSWWLETTADRLAVPSSFVFFLYSPLTASAEFTQSRTPVDKVDVPAVNCEGVESKVKRFRIQTICRCDPRARWHRTSRAEKEYEHRSESEYNET